MPDLKMNRAIHDSLRKKSLLPKTHLVDAGYVEADWILENARTIPPVEIVGPLRANVQWQATEKKGYELTDFAIDWENEKVTCPAGKTTTNWYQRKYAGADKVRVRFKRSQCKNCENRTFCTRSGDGRSLLFSLQAKYDWLAEQRRMENTEK